MRQLYGQATGSLKTKARPLISGSNISKLPSGCGYCSVVETGTRSETSALSPSWLGARQCAGHEPVYCDRTSMSSCCSRVLVLETSAGEAGSFTVGMRMYIVQYSVVQVCHTKLGSCVYDI